MAAWRRAATCSINWNAAINPGSGRGCAVSPCWNRNAGSATKPPANSASPSAAWLPTHPASPAPSAPTGPSRTACTGPWMSPSTTTRCAPAPRPQPIIWRCSNTSPSTLSDSTRSNGKAASKPADSSPLPPTYTALNCSDSYDVHAIALARDALQRRQHADLAANRDNIAVTDCRQRYETEIQQFASAVRFSSAAVLD